MSVLIALLSTISVVVPVGPELIVALRELTCLLEYSPASTCMLTRIMLYKWLDLCSAKRFLQPGKYLSNSRLYSTADSFYPVSVRRRHELSTG